MVSRIVYLMLFVVVVNAATWMEGLPSKPKELAHKKGCYIREINDVIPFGEQITALGLCYGIECSRHMLYYSSCGTVSTDDPKCYVTNYELTAPYPNCCPEVRCDIENNYL